jgi:hypothetical protein
MAVFAEPLAAAFRSRPRSASSRARPALVLGDGRLGLLCAQVLALEGLEVLIYGGIPSARLPARGCRHAARRRRSPTGASTSWIEATGDPAMLQRALLFTRPRGMLVLKTTSERPAPLDLAPLVVDEIILVGSRCGPFAPALEALRTGRRRRVALDPRALPLGRAAGPGRAPSRGLRSCGRRPGQSRAPAAQQVLLAPDPRSTHVSPDATRMPAAQGRGGRAGARASASSTTLTGRVARGAVRGRSRGPRLPAAGRARRTCAPAGRRDAGDAASRRRSSSRSRRARAAAGRPRRAAPRAASSWRRARSATCWCGRLGQWPRRLGYDRAARASLPRVGPRSSAPYPLFGLYHSCAPLLARGRRAVNGLPHGMRAGPWPS